MKKSVVCLMAFLLAIPMSFAATFDDVATTQDNYVAIEYLVSIGTLQGYDDGTFQPERTINRAELMKVLVAGQGLSPDEEVYKDCFPDVTDDWYAKYVCYAYEQDWVGGYPDLTFKPAQTVNKVEALKMLINALNLSDMLLETVEEDLFDDTDNSAWYAPYIEVAKNLNLLEVTTGDYDPAGDMNRGGVAEYIFRTLVVQELESNSYTTTDRETFLTAHDLSDLVEEVAVSENELYVVDYVVDGDTLKLDNGEYVRLLGVDAPETDECYEQESTDYLADLIGDSEVSLVADEINDDRDIYDRLLRYVYVDDELLNLTMVEDGYAEYYDSYDITMADDFETAEQEASDSGLGLWEACVSDEVTQTEGGDLYISYVFYDGEVYQVESDEYVEITNQGDETANLEGYYIMGSKGDERYTFPDVELAAGESIKVYTNQGDYSFENDQAVWSNSGETVYLYDEGGSMVDSYSY